MDLFAYNQRAWDAEVRRGNRWTVPVSRAGIAAARRGEWSVVLTPRVPVPRAWFPTDLAGVRVLALASGGGQQGPVLAAAGAAVTVLDASAAQLARDREVAARDGLDLALEQGDMRDLSRFADESIDLVFHPCANTFVADVRPVWRECHRVLRPGGTLLAGFLQPVHFLFSDAAREDGPLLVTRALPFDETRDLSPEDRRALTEREEPLVVGHTLADQLGGQLAAGFVLVDLYEDRTEGSLLTGFIADCLATRAMKRDAAG